MLPLYNPKAEDFTEIKRKTFENFIIEV